MLVDSDEEDIDIIPAQRTSNKDFQRTKFNTVHRRSASHRVQHRWSALQKEEVVKYLGGYLQMRRRPGKDVIVAAQEQSDVLKLQKWQLIRDYVVNSIRAD